MYFYRTFNTLITGTVLYLAMSGANFKGFIKGQTF